MLNLLYILVGCTTTYFSLGFRVRCIHVYWKIVITS